MFIGIIGSGTMGIGIAQVAATSGCKVFLYDANPAQTEKSLQNLQQTLNKLAVKQKISATEAKQMGLIADLFADDSFTGQSMEVLTTLSNLPTKAISLTKKAFNESYDNNLSQQLDLEGILQQEAAESADFMEGVAAFLEKRKPNYQGK